MSIIKAVEAGVNAQLDNGWIKNNSLERTDAALMFPVPPINKIFISPTLEQEFQIRKLKL